MMTTIEKNTRNLLCAKDIRDKLNIYPDEFGVDEFYVLLNLLNHWFGQTGGTEHHEIATMVLENLFASSKTLHISSHRCAKALDKVFEKAIKAGEKTSPLLTLQEISVERHSTLPKVEVRYSLGPVLFDTLSSSKNNRQEVRVLGNIKDSLLFHTL